MIEKIRKKAYREPYKELLRLFEAGITQEKLEAQLEDAERKLKVIDKRVKEAFPRGAGPKLNALANSMGRARYLGYVNHLNYLLNALKDLR